MPLKGSPGGNTPATENGEPAAPRKRFTIRVKELSARDRRHLLRHFLALDNNDRLLRFGSVLPDELITRYVENINFDRDAIFGVYDNRMNLVGVGHLAFAPREAMPMLSDATEKERVAEFGVSVSASARGMGIGSRLFERAAIRCRNADVDTLYMHFLASNRTMAHIARKAGMQIQRAHGEADAYLRVLPADPKSVMQEAVDEQKAMLAYTLKSNVRAIGRWLKSLAGFGKSDGLK